jgi:hypothetical protein
MRQKPNRWDCFVLVLSPFYVNINEYVRWAAVILEKTIGQDVTSCSLVGMYQRFGGWYYLRIHSSLSWRWNQYATPKRLPYLPPYTPQHCRRQYLLPFLWEIHFTSDCFNAWMSVNFFNPTNNCTVTCMTGAVTIAVCRHCVAIYVFLVIFKINTTCFRNSMKRCSL